MMAELVLSSPTSNTKCRRFPPQSQTVSPPGLEIWPGALSWPGFPGLEAGTFFFFKSLSGTEKELRLSQGRLGGGDGAG